MLGHFILLLAKLGIMILPMTVLWLASRRLVLSRTANAWLYAATAIFAALTTIGLVPWAFAIGSSHPIFFVFAAMSPTIWYSVATACNSSRHLSYGSELRQTFDYFKLLVEPRKKLSPLILEGADWPDAPTPMFRHHEERHHDETAQAERIHTRQPDPAPEPDLLSGPMPAPFAKAEWAADMAPAKPDVVAANGAAIDQISEPIASFLDVARTMRRNKSSESRRIKLLPAPGHTSVNGFPDAAT